MGSPEAPASVGAVKLPTTRTSRPSRWQCALSVPLLLALLTTSVACDKKPTGDQASAAASTGGAGSSAPAGSAPALGSVVIPTGAGGGAAVPVETATLTVTNPGNGPRRVLSYKYVAGAIKRFSMKMQITVSILMNGQAMPGGAPMQIEIAGTIVTKEVLPNGSSVREVTLESFKPKMPQLPPAAVAQIEQQMAAFAGMKLRERVSPSGVSEGVELDPLLMQNPQAGQMLQNLKDGISNALLPLPLVEIGEGARWEDHREVAMNGLAVTQVGTFELTKLVGDQATVAITIKQSAKPGEVADPRLPPGTKTEILAMEGSGTGTVKANLATLNVESAMKMQNQVETKVTTAGGAGVPGADPSAPAAPAAPQSVRSLMTTNLELTTRLGD